MKFNISKIVFFLICFFVFFYIGGNILTSSFFVKAQTSEEKPLPFFECGNSEAEDLQGKKCCPPQDISMRTINPYLGFAEKIPILGTEIIIQFERLFGGLQEVSKKSTPVSCYIGIPSKADPADPDCVCLSYGEITPTPYHSVIKMCETYVRGERELNDCKDCANGGGYWSGITCFYGNINDFITQNIFRFGVGLGGLIALLCIIYAAFQLQTSQGSPEKIKKAQELLTSCIMGLMLIIFSVFILKLIGVDILRIPGFGR